MTKMAVLFHPIKTKKNSKGECPLYIRITVNKERTEFSFGFSIPYSDWDNKAQKLLTNSQQASTINSAISLATTKLLRIQNEFNLSDVAYNASMIKDRYLNKVEASKTLLQLFDYHAKNVKQLVGKGYSLGRLRRYKVARGKLERFIKANHKTSDIALDKLNFQFINDFEFYLKTEDNLSTNTTSGYLKILKLLIKVAVKQDWINSDPFISFKCKQKDVAREYLSQTEIDTLLKQEFATARMEMVRDVFVFCCYTGLAYSDVYKLNSSHIRDGVDGNLWLFIDRTKTEQSCRIPLLQTALEILGKYKKHPECQVKNRLLPVCTNQKMNEYLKIMADVCGINKTITCHVARHTYATTVLMNNGVSFEVTSKLLGHKNLATTQIYAKITDKRLSDEMLKLSSVLTM